MIFFARNQIGIPSRLPVAENELQVPLLREAEAEVHLQLQGAYHVPAGGGGVELQPAGDIRDRAAPVQDMKGKPFIRVAQIHEVRPRKVELKILMRPGMLNLLLADGGGRDAAIGRRFRTVLIEDLLGNRAVPYRQAGEVLFPLSGVDVINIVGAPFLEDVLHESAKRPSVRVELRIRVAAGVEHESLEELLVAHADVTLRDELVRHPLEVPCHDLDDLKLDVLIDFGMTLLALRLLLPPVGRMAASGGFPAREPTKGVDPLFVPVAPARLLLGGGERLEDFNRYGYAFGVLSVASLRNHADCGRLAGRSVGGVHQRPPQGRLPSIARSTQAWTDSKRRKTLPPPARLRETGWLNFAGAKRHVSIVREPSVQTERSMTDLAIIFSL